MGVPSAAVSQGGPQSIKVNSIVSTVSSGANITALGAARLQYSGWRYGSNGKLYMSGWTGGSRGRISTQDIGPAFDIAGKFLGALSFGLDTASYFNGDPDMDGFQYGTNSFMDAVGVFGGPLGAFESAEWSILNTLPDDDIEMLYQGLQD